MTIEELVGMNARTKERLRIGLLLAAVALVYANTLLNQFTLDDGLYITRNPQVTQFSWRGLLAAEPGHQCVPAAHLCHLGVQLGAAGSAPVRLSPAQSLVARGSHAAACIFCSARCSKKPRMARPWRWWPPRFSPCIRFTPRLSPASWDVRAAGRRDSCWPPGSCICATGKYPPCSAFALALLSKESAAAFLPLVLVGDYARAKWKPPVRYARIAGVTAIYLGLLWKVQGGRFGQAGIAPLDNPLAALPAGWRILNAIRVAWKYVALQIYPATLSCDYSFNQIRCTRTGATLCPRPLPRLQSSAHGFGRSANERANGFWRARIYFGCICDDGEHPDTDGNHPGRAACLPSVGRIVFAAGGNLDAAIRRGAAKTRANGGLGAACLIVGGSRRAHGGPQSGLEKQYWPFSPQPCAPRLTAPKRT